MRIGIAYASTTGHAQKIAEFATAELRAAGHQVDLCRAAQADGFDPGEHAAMLLVGSVRLGRYQAALRAFARRHCRVLNSMPGALLSVSLSAAGGSAQDLAGLRRCEQRLQRATHWRPSVVYHVGGALSFSRYGPLTRLAIRAIARRRGMDLDGHSDVDLTDYPALAVFIDRFVEGVAGTQRTAPLAPGRPDARR